MQELNKIIFRSNAGPSVGLGHLVRCRALAQALVKQGVQCIMVGPDLEYRQNNDSREAFVDWIPIRNWNSAEEDAAGLALIAGKKGARFLVLDDYRVNENYQLLLQQAGLQWLQFDGGQKRHLWADIILNTQPGAREEDYQDVIHNPWAQLLLGLKYAILRPEFPPKDFPSPGRSIKQILVTFGGGDDRGAIEFVLSTLLPIVNLSVRFLVITGKNNPRNPEIQSWVDNHGGDRVILAIDPASVSTQMAGCDLAIMAGGTTTYEAVCCSLPMILIAIADNQIKQSIAWEKRNAAVYVGEFNKLKPEDLIVAFSGYLDKKMRGEIVQNHLMVDGLGSSRVAEHIISLCG